MKEDTLNSVDWEEGMDNGYRILLRLSCHRRGHSLPRHHHHHHHETVMKKKSPLAQGEEAIWAQNRTTKRRIHWKL
ncbi:MAG TPA: hypothetical protein PKX17_06700, partial [Candidatus Methanomethylicus sp.]|nr:hypothetical protein [Candidatus Methanomethylicus sp.]